MALGAAPFKNANIMGIQPSADDVRLPGRNLVAMTSLFGWFLDGRLRPQVTMAQRRATGRLMLTT